VPSWGASLSCCGYFSKHSSPSVWIRSRQTQIRSRQCAHDREVGLESSIALRLKKLKRRVRRVAPLQLGVRAEQLHQVVVGALDGEEGVNDQGRALEFAPPLHAHDKEGIGARLFFPSIAFSRYLVIRRSCFLRSRSRCLSDVVMATALLFSRRVIDHDQEAAMAA
jgi:hypothetical protein